jgi:hypothetical protein
MFTFGATIPATVPQWLEIPVGLTNYPILRTRYGFNIMNIYILTITYFLFCKRGSTCYIGLREFIIMYKVVFLAESITLVLLT